MRTGKRMSARKERNVALALLCFSMLSLVRFREEIMKYHHGGNQKLWGEEAGRKGATFLNESESTTAITANSPLFEQGKPFITNLTRASIENFQSCNSHNHCDLDKRLTASSRIISYAVLGFPKCGTTTIAQVLGGLSQAPVGDRCHNAIDSIIQSYLGWEGYQQYGSIPDRKNQNILTGLKCPAGLEMGSIIKSFAKYQPQTVIIVGVRHPVLAFQSYYNMLINNGWHLEDPHELTHSCHEKNKKNVSRSCSSRGCPRKFGSGVICLDRFRYHRSLAKLGKTPLKRKELNLLNLYPSEKPFRSYNVANKIFLYDVKQLEPGYDNNQIFWKDLSGVLDLPFDIPSQNKTIKPGLKNSAEKQSKRDKSKIDICKSVHTNLRAILMTFATQSADWICQYFLLQDDVFVSTPDHFCSSIMVEWKQDPCV